MKLSSRVIPLVTVAAAAVGLVGCAAPMRSGDHAHARMESMDPQAHCEMHRKKMGGMSSSEREAMMQEHMKSMPPEMRQRMQAMHEQCK